MGGGDERQRAFPVICKRVAARGEFTIVNRARQAADQLA
jgi:hypothetical protein